MVSLLQNCKLTYFDIAGRGEATRLALTIGAITFTDDRVQFKDWKSVKGATPWGSLPFLTLEDGRQVAQQRAILRFVGKETGLYPMNNHFQAAKIDELLDSSEDIGAKTNAVGQGLSQTEKEAARLASCQSGGVTHQLLGKIDNFIAANGQGGHAVGDSLTIADLFLYAATSNLVSGMFDGVPSTAVDSFHHIMACRKLVRSQPAVQKWYDESKASLPASFGPLN